MQSYGRFTASFSKRKAIRPSIVSVIVGASKLSQLEKIKALDFDIPSELANRLEKVSKPESQFPYTFFDAEIQGMIHGGAICDKPDGYQPGVLIESAAVGVS